LGWCVKGLALSIYLHLVTRRIIIKLTTWNRGKGHVSVVLFDNNTSAAVSTKLYKSKKGAEAANARLVEFCGEGYSDNNIPWKTTNPETGEQTENYRLENLAVVK
jgi:hypothetical protein